jgi:hypothetical protein
MGPDLGDLYHALWQHTGRAFTTWQEFTGLFEKSEQRVRTLNRAAGHFFGVVQGVLWEQTLLHLQRLTAPERSLRRDNLTVRRIPPLIGESSVAERAADAVAKAVDAARFAKDWRDRSIAHLDYELFVKPESARPITPATTAQVKTALMAIVDVLNVVSLHFEESTSVFDMLEPMYGAERLVSVLERGLTSETAEQAEERRRFGAD